jgi:tetratricopeptide (TPR) repeat protein
MTFSPSARSPTWDPGRRLKDASDLLRQGRRAEAALVLRALIAEAPDLVEAHRLHAVAMQEMGELTGAEAAFRQALAREPSLASAATGLSEVLCAQGRHEEAVALLRPFISDRTTNLSLLTYFGHALRGASLADEAVTLLSRAAAANPRSAVADHNLAGALADADRFPESEAAIRRAFAKGLDAPETWRIQARALTGLGRGAEAEQAYRESLRRRPDNAETIGELARLVWMRTGDADAARAVFAQAPAALARAPALLREKARLLEYVGDIPGAYEAMSEAIVQDGHPTLHVLAARLAGRFDPGRALDHAQRARALWPDDTGVAAAFCEANLVAGRADVAAKIAWGLHQRLTTDQYAITLLATAWRIQGDPRGAELYDYEAFVGRSRLDKPAGWASLPAYLHDLRQALAPLHAFKGHPIGQSLRHGSQTRQDLTRSTAPAIKALFEAIDGPIRRYIAALGGGGDPLRRRITGGYAIKGAWSVKLRPNGYHVNHIHAEGWLSSALHLELPSAVRTAPEGWLKFGEPGIPTAPSAPADCYVKPQVGQLVLFPSYMWHGTEPFSGDQDRLTIAFDVVPA